MNSNNGQIEDETSLQEIKIGVASTAIGTRGTGTVGGLGADNQWAGQEVNVFMLKKETLDSAFFYHSKNDSTLLYWDTKFITPTATNSAVATPDASAFNYYPTSGNFDFWGYRLDDAKVGEAKVNGDSLYVEFALNGSQDVMVAKPKLENADTLKMGEHPERIFSAFAARRGVQPNLEFNHVLSRLTFTLQAGTTIKEKIAATCGYDLVANTLTSDKGVFVDTVKVYSKTTGKLVVAYTPAAAANFATPASQAVFDEAKEAFYLMERTSTPDQNLTEFTPVRPKYDAANEIATIDPIGEAILVAPDSEYEIEVHTVQNIDGRDHRALYKQTVKVSDPSNTGAVFEAGKSYSVKIVTYGLEGIVVTATLNEWQNGGETEDINPDDF